MNPVLLAHLALTWALVGLIWVVQVVHYPLLARVGAQAYPAYQRGHVRRITWVVAPLMLGELLLAVWLVLAPPPGVSSGLAGAGLALVGVVWLSTVTLQVPQHAALEGGFDARVHARLVAGNWLRTAAWSLRGLVALALCAAG